MSPTTKSALRNAFVGTSENSVFKNDNFESRAPIRASSDLVREQIVRGASALKSNAAVGDPWLQAQVAILYLNRIAESLEPQTPPGAIARLWQKSCLRESVAGELSEFRKAFHLPPSLIDEYRQTHPDICFEYILYREILNGRIPVVASDIKETLAPLVSGRDFAKLLPRQRGNAAGYNGVREQIQELLRLGPVYLVTGDTHETVLEQFLVPNEWVRVQGEALVPGNPDAKNLVWLPRTGMEIVRYNPQDGHFTREALVQGLTTIEVQRVNQILDQVAKDLEIHDFFADPARQYEHIDGQGPCWHETREGVRPGETSIAFYPAGVLLPESRDRFGADPSNVEFLERVAVEVSRRLEVDGLAHVRANRAGRSTIDVVTSTKGAALMKLKERFIDTKALVVFLGDRIALNGNDAPAINVADLSVQVGAEWDPSQFPAGDRTLLHSQYRPPEHGQSTAWYLKRVALARRLALTGLLEPCESISGWSSSSTLSHGVIDSSVSAQVARCQPWETRAAVGPLIAPRHTLPVGASETKRWVVLTGTTSAGKTETLKALQSRCFKTLGEVARDYLRNEMQGGRTLSDIRANQREYRRILFSKQVEAERSINATDEEWVFLDRSSIDHLSYYRIAGIDPNKVAAELPGYRYGAVFHLDSLSFEDDGIREVSPDRRRFLDAQLEREYRALEYRPIRVPVMSIEERVDFILEQIAKL
jgi:predicted ATPase